jgi:hypothetical protein
MSRRKRRTKKLTKVRVEDTNKDVAASPKRPDDAGWDDLDQAFFASAPPDVPELPREPERFDDLFPVAAVPEMAGRATRERPLALQRASATAAATRASLARAWRELARRTGPSIATAGRQAARLTTSAWRGSSRALASAGRATLRTARPAAARVAGALRGLHLSGQTIAIAAASVILLTGLSAVVVASRSGAHGNLPATPLGPRATAAGTTVAAVGPAPALPFPADPEPARLQSIAPDPGSSPARAEQREQPEQHESEPPRSRASAETRSETHRRHAEPAKRTVAPAAASAPHKHRKYSAERDLMMPSFMQAGPKPAAPARPAARAPAYAPPPPARPVFSR